MLGKLLNRATAYLRDEQETLRRSGALTYPGDHARLRGHDDDLPAGLRAAAVHRRSTPTRGGPAPAHADPDGHQRFARRPLAGDPDRLAIDRGRRRVLLLPHRGRAARAGTTSSSTCRCWARCSASCTSRAACAWSARMAAAGVNLLDCVTTAHDLCANTYFRDLWSASPTRSRRQAALRAAVRQPAGAASVVADDPQRREERQAGFVHGTGGRLCRAGTQGADRRPDALHRAGHDHASWA